MKRLVSQKMKQLLAEGIRKAKKLPKVKYPDYFIPLFSRESKNGWHYQVSKLYQEVVVYAFRPPKNQYARPADYYYIKPKKDMK